MGSKMETKTITLQLTDQEINILSTVCVMNINIYASETYDKGVAEMFLPIFEKIQKELSEHVSLDALAKQSQVIKAMDSNENAFDGVIDSGKAVAQDLIVKIQDDNDELKTLTDRK